MAEETREKHGNLFGYSGRFSEQLCLKKKKSGIDTYQFRHLVQKLVTIYFLSSSIIILVRYWKEVGVHRDNIKKNHKQKKKRRNTKVKTFLVKMDLEDSGLFSVQQNILHRPVDMQLALAMIGRGPIRLRKLH
jgi:hypothetical protein